MPVRTQRDAAVSRLLANINAGTPATMTSAQILEYAVSFVALDKLLATDPMAADAAALLGAVTASELDDLLVQAHAQAAFDTAINTAGSRAEILANSTARTAMVGSTRAVQRLTTSGTFDAFLADSTMRSALFGSSTARAAILGSSTLRAFLLGTPTAGNLTFALDDANMRAAMYADATTRGEMLASATVMDAVWANATARDAAFGDATMRAAVVGSTNAMTRLMANATARQAAWANANMPAAIAGSTTALGVIDDTQAHMDEALSATYSSMRSALITTATARTAITTSAVWMKRCVNVAGFIAAAFADSGFLTAWRASSALTARELPTMVATDANFTASSENDASRAAWKAADSSTSTNWRSASATPQWLKYDFGSGKSVHIHQMVLQGSSEGRPNAWVLEGSNDNTAWTSVASGNATNNELQQLVTVSHAAGYRYFRWTVSTDHFYSTAGVGDFDLKGFEVQ